MTYSEKMKVAGNNLTYLFPVFFLMGFFSSLIDVLVHRYFTYRMLRTVFSIFQRRINFWILFLISGFIVVWLIFSMAKLIGRLVHSILSDKVSVPIIRSDSNLTIFVTALNCFIVLFYCGWIINHYWLPAYFHPTSLWTDAVIFLVTLLVGIISSRVKWKKLLTADRLASIKKITLPLIVLTLALNIFTLIDKNKESSDHPNIVLIIVDTLRADHLQCYGYQRDTSPNIDALSRQAILFKNAIVPAPWTSPSISSIFTSQYPAVLGFQDQAVKIHPKFLTLPKMLKQHHYTTKGIISHTFLSPGSGFDEGFDSYDDENAKGHDHVSSPSLTEKAINFIEKNRYKQFFLFIHYFDPHYNYIQHEPTNYYPDYPGDLHDNEHIEILRGKAPTMTAEDIDYIKALYDSEIRFTDEHIGKLFDKLKALDLFDESLIVFTADHGEEFFERGDHWIGHTKKLYHELIHVPLIIKPAGYKGTQVVEESVGLIDLMPTLMSHISLRIPGNYTYEGSAFDLAGDEEDENDPIFSETKRLADLRSATWKRWKYIHDPQTDEEELYDLLLDPLETNNAVSENMEILYQFREIIRDWDEHIRSRISGSKIRKPDFTKKQLEHLRSLGYIK